MLRPLIGSWLMRSRSSVALTVGWSVATSGVMSFTSTLVDVAPGVMRRIDHDTFRHAKRERAFELLHSRRWAESVYDPGMTAGKM